MIISRILRPLAFLLGSASLLFGVQATKTVEPKALDWNQFRGPLRNAHSFDTGLLKQWPSNGPPLAWKATGLGVGFSSVCHSGNRVFTMGEADNKCFLIALSAADGKLLWKLPIGGPFTENQGGPGPRSTPATDGTLVFAMAPNGELACVRAADGRPVWQKNMSSLGAQKPGFGFVESPFIDGNVLLVSPGGTVVAMNKFNGGLFWKSKRLKGATDYSSLSVAEISRVRQYLVMTDKSVAGILAANGTLLWEVDYPGDRAVVPTPVYANGVVFVSAGYGVGGKGVKVTVAGGQIRAEEAYLLREFQIHHGGMVQVGDHVYGLNDQGVARCAEIATGKTVWTERSVGKGSIAYADGHLVCRGENGTVAWIEASPAGYKEKGRFNPPERSANKSWAHPVVSGKKLYLREQDVLFCYDLKGP